MPKRRIGSLKCDASDAQAALPVFETVTVCATLVTPAVELKAKAVGFSVSTGPTAVTVNVPGT
jgi:hypothetical protein